MDYKYIEALVIKAKDGDITSKEKLVQEFTPYIINLSRKTFIHGYDFSDIQNECYKYLFKCLSSYNAANHKFVAYATIGIRNNLNYLIRRNLTHSQYDGAPALYHNEDVLNTISSNINIEEILCNKIDHSELRHALSLLSDSEKELIHSIFFNNDTIKTYASSKNISCSTVHRKKVHALKKIMNYFQNKDLICSY